MESIDIDKLDLNQFNIYPSYRIGQAESVRGALQAYENYRTGKIKSKIFELSSPTGSGKTAINRATGMALLKLYPGNISKVIYTTPLRNLVKQIADEHALGIPTVMGRSNYPCCTLRMGMMADSCPYRTAMLIRMRPEECRNCEYLRKKAMFKQQPLVASTLDFFLYNHKRKDPNKPGPRDALIIDESASLENKLLHQFGITLPDHVDIANLVPSLHDWLVDLMEQQLIYQDQLDDLGFALERRDPKVLKQVMDITSRLNKVERKQGTVSRIISMASDPDAYFIDHERKFKLMRGKWPFYGMIKDLEFVIMSSGTPTTSLLTENYTRIEAPHPIPVDRRRVYYSPEGKMSMNNVKDTLPRMASRIIALHKANPKKTLVHCHSYTLARMLRDEIVQQQPTFKKIVLLQEKKNAPPNDDFCGNRDDALEKFLTHSGQIIWLSVGYAEGLSLDGNLFELNIIPKVPYPGLGDEWVVKRNVLDEKELGLNKWYRLETSVAIQQAAGRCTRGPKDFSKTYILDANFGYFFSQNKIFFEKWFKDALVWETKEQREMRKRSAI